MTEKIAPKVSPELIKTLWEKWGHHGLGAVMGAKEMLSGGEDEDIGDRALHGVKGFVEGEAISRAGKYAIPLATKVASAALKKAPAAVERLVPALQREFGVQDKVADAVQQQFAAKSPSDKIKQIVQTNPARLGRYGTILGDALQKGGDKEYAARSFVLGQTDPQFQQLQKQLSEEK